MELDFQNKNEIGAVTQKLRGGDLKASEGLFECLIRAGDKQIAYIAG